MKAVLLSIRPISIHATLAGGDVKIDPACKALRADFNPRHPCGWRPYSAGREECKIYFNPRHPCGWRLKSNAGFFLSRLFQSTPPLRVATILRPGQGRQCLFQSTPPLRVATFPKSGNANPEIGISIHATLAGGDVKIIDTAGTG